jgi:hypothetical protein
MNGRPSLIDLLSRNRSPLRIPRHGVGAQTVP